MEILNDKETMNYVGGFKLTKTVIAIIAGVTSFVLGILDGLSNPQKCIRRWF